MTTLVRAELLKQVTIRLPYGLLITAAGLTATMAVLTAALAGGPGAMAAERLDNVSGLTSVLSTTYLAMLMALVFGVTVSTGEFRHLTATATYLATPDRVRVLIGKEIAAVALGLVFGAVGAVITSTVGLGFVAAKGYPVTVGTGTFLRYGFGATAASGLLAAAGVGFGSVIRGQLGAVTTVLLWGFLGETSSGGSRTRSRPTCRTWPRARWQARLRQGEPRSRSSPRPQSSGVGQ